jgi:hypothetical protein
LPANQNLRHDRRLRWLVIWQNISLGHDFAEPSPLTKAFNMVEMFRTQAQGKRRSRFAASSPMSAVAISVGKLPRHLSYRRV